MIKIVDNEGEMQVTLTDINSYEELHAKIDAEDQSLIEILGDTPFWSYMLVTLDEWTELSQRIDYPIAEIEDDTWIPEEDQKRSCTYAEWMKDCLEWAREEIQESS